MNVHRTSQYVTGNSFGPPGRRNQKVVLVRTTLSRLWRKSWDDTKVRTSYRNNQAREGKSGPAVWSLDRGPSIGIGRTDPQVVRDSRLELDSPFHRSFSIMRKSKSLEKESPAPLYGPLIVVPP